MIDCNPTTPNPTVALAELPALVESLVGRIRTAGFQPDLVVYIESGARLPAAMVCGLFGVGGVPVIARRRGHLLKRLLAPLTRVVPRCFLDALRRAEERSGVHARSGRTVLFPEEVEFQCRDILVLDDAVDTGVTLKSVKMALIARGADPARLRSAVLAATTDAGRSQTDFHVLERNCVFPWSADSRERSIALRRMQNVSVPGI